MVHPTGDSKKPKVTLRLKLRDISMATAAECVSGVLH